MKTKSNWIKLVLAVLGITVQIACNKSGGGSGAAATPAPTYQIVNGSCVQAGTTTAVPMSYCNGINNGGYYMSGGQCYSSNGAQAAYQLCQGSLNNNGYTLGSDGVCRLNGQQVQQFLCQQNQQYPNQQYPGQQFPNTGTGQQCYGTYYYYNMYVTCTGWNCRGYTLTSQNGQQVFCQ